MKAYHTALIVSSIAGLILAGLYVFVPPTGLKSYRLDTPVFASAYHIDDQARDDVSFYLIFPYGEAHNPFDEGLAHYTEHLAWFSAQGLAKTGSKPSSRLRRNHANAWTQATATVYKARTEACRAQTELPKLLKAAAPIDIETSFAQEEAGIVLREFHNRTHPLKHSYESLNAELYKGSGLARSVIGTPSSIQGFNLQKAKALHGQTHDLSQAHLVSTGDISGFEHEELLNDLSLFELTRPVVATDLRAEQTQTAIRLPDLASLLSAIEAGIVSEPIQISEPKILSPSLVQGFIIKTEACRQDLDCFVKAAFAEAYLDSSLKGSPKRALVHDLMLADQLEISLEYLGKDEDQKAVFDLNLSAQASFGIDLNALDQQASAALMTALNQGPDSKDFDRLKDRFIQRQANDRDKEATFLQLLIKQLTQGLEPFSLQQLTRTSKDLSHLRLQAFMGSLSAPYRQVRVYTTKD